MEQHYHFYLINVSIRMEFNKGAPQEVTFATILPWKTRHNTINKKELAAFCEEGLARWLSKNPIDEDDLKRGKADVLSVSYLGYMTPSEFDPKDEESHANN